MWNKLLLLIIGSVFIASTGLAEEYIGISRFLVLSDQALSQAEHDDLIFTYNSKNFEGSLLDGYSKAELIEMIKTNTVPEIKKGQKRTEFHIPFGPKIDWSVENQDKPANAKASRIPLLKEFRQYNFEFQKESIHSINRNFENLSEQELREFLSKKHGFLLGLGNGIEKTFLKFRIKPPYRLIQGLLNSLNLIFFQKSEQFVRSNTIGATLCISAGIGATFGKLLYDVMIAKSPLKKWIRPDFGFYLANTAGIGISRVKVEGKTAWVLDMFFDFESFKRAFLPIFEVSGTVGYSVLMENRDLPKIDQRFFTSRDNYKSTLYAPIIGASKTGPTSFSSQHGLGISLPLPTSFYETNLSRRYFHVVLSRSYEKEKVPVRSANACFGFYNSL